MDCDKVSPGPDLLALMPALRAFSRSLCRQGEDPDDLVQETLVKALGAIHQFEAGTNMKSWLFTIMRNAFYSAKRKEQRERPGTVDCISRIDVPCEAVQEWALRRSEIGEALDRLPPGQRQAIVLVGVLEITYAEAAKICDCNIGTIKSRLNRARTRLAEILDESRLSAVEGAHTLRSHQPLSSGV